MALRADAFQTTAGSNRIKLVSAAARRAPKPGLAHSGCQINMVLIHANG
jgi:hypothetical protein